MALRRDERAVMSKPIQPMKMSSCPCNVVQRRVRRRLLAAAFWCGAASMAQADGLKVNVDMVAWPKWQARVGVLTLQPGAMPSDLLGDGNAPRVAALLGDYYFTGPGFDRKRVGGGLRATTGWLYGGSVALGAAQTQASTVLSTTVQRSSLVAGDRPFHAAYIGIGYTGLSLKHGWGVLADVGVLGVGGLGAPRVVDNEYSIRGDRLTPAVRLGMSYAF